MARLRDVPVVIRRRGFFRFLKNIWAEVGSDAMFMYASALAYSWLFAIFPFFIFLLSLLPYLPNSWKGYVEKNIGPVMREHVPHAADGVIGAIEDLITRPKAGLLSVGLLITIWGASGGMNMTMTAMDAAYDVEKPRPMWKQRPIAILLTVVIASLLIAVAVLVPIGTLLSNLFIRYGHQWLGWEPGKLTWIVLVFGIVRITAALLLLLLMLALLHKYGTAANTRFQLFSPGAIFTILVWFVLGSAFRIYIDKFGKYDKTYGSVGGVAILLLFFYIDALVLLVGAEINAEINREVNIDSEAGRDPDPDLPAAEID
jgi:membrane protein